MLEFEWVEYLKTRMVGRADIALGIGDDAALLQVSAGKLIAISTDTLVQGTHFLPGTPASYMGHKALAVNLSDLAAMGATPRWFTMALSLPAPDALALEPFLDGLLDLADAHEISLVGGDTTRGPLAITITVLGEVAPSLALQRSHARVGDGIYVSGTLGDAAAALALRLASSSPGSAGTAEPAALSARLDCPTPRVRLGQKLVGIAHACIDVSDGLLADLRHICQASAVGAQVYAQALPISAALRAHCDAAKAAEFAQSGGDDYELCFTAPSSAEAALAQLAQSLSVPITRIGVITAQTGLVLLDASGAALPIGRHGYQHFVS
jgi:thiamine-monophosphate kinase